MDNSKYEDQLSEFLSASINRRPEFIKYYKYPCLTDDTSETSFDTHYLYHVSWAIRKTVQLNPPLHLDVGSSLYFSTAISAFTNTIFMDFRPACVQLDNLNCIQGDLTKAESLPNDLFESVSCMHVMEHIGLGRYGDELDVNADIKAMKNLKALVRPRGRLLFVVPVGQPAIFFNAHRVYSANWINNFFHPEFQLREFYFIPGPMNDLPRITSDLSETLSYQYGCGCYEFIKQ